MKPYRLSCPACGNEWNSIAKGPTRCKRCRHAFRVPAQIFREALGRWQRPRTRAVRAQPVTGRPDPGVSTSALRSASPHRASPHESDRNPLADALELVQALVRPPTPVSRSRLPKLAQAPTNPTAPTAPLPHPPAPGPAVPWTDATVDRHQASRPAYALEVGCGCGWFAWDSPEPPSVVRCQEHGSTPVRSLVSADGKGSLPPAVPA